MMKAIAVEYEGIKFRSKLEARWYIFMKKLGWNIIYEPEIEGINGWIPDFLIIGRSHKTLVDVKGINRDKEWCECVWSRAKNEAIIKSKHKDYDKILNSGIKDLHDYELLILGANLRLDGNSAMGILHTRAENHDENGVSTKLNDLYRSSETVFSCVDKKIGFMDHEGVWCCRITGEGGKTYIFRRNGYDDADDYEYKFIDKAWNESWSKLQWKGK